MGTLNEMVKARQAATADGLCGHQTGSAWTRASVCGKLGKYVATNTDTGEKHFLCGIHARSDKRLYAVSAR